LFLNREPEVAAERAEHLRSIVENFNFVWGNRTFSVTASIGSASISEAGVSIEEALRQADMAC
jgi:GGDEF domain-containing protein